MTVEIKFSASFPV